MNGFSRGQEQTEQWQRVSTSGGIVRLIQMRYRDEGILRGWQVQGSYSHSLCPASVSTLAPFPPAPSLACWKSFLSEKTDLHFSGCDKKMSASATSVV